MNVSAAARAAGISPSGLRWYEARGVLPAAPRGENGYRNYSAADVSQLRLVLTLRRLGLNAAEAGRLARLSFESGEAANELPAALKRQRELVAERRSDLAWLDSELADLEATWHATRASTADRPAAAPIRVLFLCSANSGRSQIGEALLARVGAGRFTVQSAGNAPAAVSPLAVAVLSEVGIDWQEARSKRVEDVSGPFDYVIALSDSVSEACATIDGAHSTLHWHLPDPAGASIPAETRLAAYRRVRDEISLRLVPFVELALRTAAFSESTPLLEEVSNG